MLFTNLVPPTTTFFSPTINQSNANLQTPPGAYRQCYSCGHKCGWTFWPVHYLWTLPCDNCKKFGGIFPISMIDSVHMTPTIKTPLPGQPLELKSPLMNPPMVFSNQMIQMPQMAINQSLMFPGTMANTPRMNAPVNRQPNQSSPFSPPIFSSPVHPLNCNQNQNMQYFQNPNFQNQTCQNSNFQNPAFFQNSGIPTQLSISTPLMMTPTSLHPNMSFNSFNFQSPLPMQYPYATSTVLATPGA